MFCLIFRVGIEQVTALGIEADYTKKIRPLLSEFCFDCHMGEEAEAEVDLSSFKTITDLRQNPKTWMPNPNI